MCTVKKNAYFNLNKESPNLNDMKAAKLPELYHMYFKTKEQIQQRELAKQEVNIQHQYRLLIHAFIMAFGNSNTYIAVTHAPYYPAEYAERHDFEAALELLQQNEQVTVDVSKDQGNSIEQTTEWHYKICYKQ